MTPGEGELATAEIRRARQALREAEVLLEQGFAEGATNRIYYATFHAARAALSVKDRTSRTHTGQIKLFEEAFGAAPVLTRAFQQRVSADYGIEPFEPSIEDVRRLLTDAGTFVERCHQIVSQVTAAGPTSADPPPDL